MKKPMTVLLILAMLCGMVLPLTARADVIYEPMDSFYEEHYAQCTYVSRSYTAAGPNGTVTLYESPESAKAEATVKNGETLFVSVTYKDADGTIWGCCENWEKELCGWAPMAYLEVIYDGISFREEYGDQFVSESGSLDGSYVGKTIYFWKYPGSDAYVDIELMGEEYRPEYRTVYTDADGRTWGECVYYMGIKGYWINLEDPTADFETLFPEWTEPVTEETEPVSEPAQEIVPRESQETRVAKTAAVIAVAAVVAITAVLLYLMKKKKV